MVPEPPLGGIIILEYIVQYEEKCQTPGRAVPTLFAASWRNDYFNSAVVIIPHNVKCNNLFRTPPFFFSEKK